jgi:hypothetical protein
VKIKRIIFQIQELFRRKPKTKKAEPMFHAPLNEPFATMQKQYLASQCQSYSSMQDQMCRSQCQSTADQREWIICRNAQTLTPPQPHKLHGRIWHVPKSTVGRVEIKETIPFAIPFAIHSAIVDALDHAKTKHPHFADTDAEAVTVIAEELLEVNTAALKVMQSINDQADRDNLFVELAQLNATTIRMMEKLLNGENKEFSGCIREAGLQNKECKFEER